MPDSTNTSSTTFVLSDRVYEFFKKLVRIILPAFGALYFSLSQIWGLPKGEEVVGTISCVTLFFGVTLGISSAQYDKSGKAYDGEAVITEPEPGKQLVSLELNDDPHNLHKKKAVRFKVTKKA